MDKGSCMILKNDEQLSASCKLVIHGKLQWLHDMIPMILSGCVMHCHLVEMFTIFNRMTCCFSGRSHTCCVHSASLDLPALTVVMIGLLNVRCRGRIRQRNNRFHRFQVSAAVLFGSSQASRLGGTQLPCMLGQDLGEEIMPSGGNETP